MRISAPDGIEPPRLARVRLAQVREHGPQSVALTEQVRHEAFVDGRPARVEFDADGPPWAARDRGAEQRAADPGERVEDELAGLGEELDEPGHQARRLVRAVGLACRVAELGGVGRRQDRLGEVQPLLARQLVERIGGVGKRTAFGHTAQRSP